MDQQGDDHLEVIDKLAGLPTGEAFVWAPVLDLLERVKIRTRETFDSGATPKPGERRIEPKQRAVVDMEALKGKLAATIERAKADDPKLLRARIAELEKGRAPVAAATLPPRRVEVPVLTDADRAMVDGLALAFGDAGVKLEALTRAIAKSAWSTPAPLPAIGPTALRRAQREQVRETIIEPGVRAVAADRANNGGLDSGARRMLQAMASFYPRALTRTQVATLSGISPSTGTFRTYVSQITVGGYAAKSGELLELTPNGHDFVGKVVRVSHEELLRVWGEKLDGGARRMLEYLAKAHGWVTRRDLASDCGISETTGTFRTYISKLYSNGLIEKSGGDAVRISETFFL